MQFAYQLLIAALTLLTTVSTNPNVSADLKTQATLVANQAIVYAQSVIQEENTPVVTPVVQNPIQSPVQNTPVTPTFGSVTPVSVPTSLVIKQNSSLLYPTYGGSCSLVVFWVDVLDQNGKEMTNQNVSITTPETPSATDLLSAITSNTYATLHFRPQQVSGDMPITISSGDLSTTTTVNLLSKRDYLLNPDGSLVFGHASKETYENAPSGLIKDLSSGTYFDLNTNMCK